MMNTPHFFDNVPSIILYDDLAHLLGAAQEGIMTYTYTDAVKLAGHSCPTVASAYMSAYKGLQALYGTHTPKRGAISVTLKGSPKTDNKSVWAAVYALIAGVDATGGFYGFKGAFNRQNLLAYDEALSYDVVLKRTDTQAQVSIHVDISSISLAAIDMKQALRIINGSASTQEAQHFGHMWQENVKNILAHIDDERVVHVTLYT